MSIRLTSLTQAVLSFGFARLVSQVLMFITMVLLARVVEPEDFGVVGYVLAVSTILLTLSDFGMSQTVQRFVTEFGEKAVRPAFAIKVLCSILVALIVVASDNLFGAFKGLGGWVGVIVVASAAQLTIMTEVASGRYGRAGCKQLLTTTTFVAGALILATQWDPVQGPLLARTISFGLIGFGLLRELLLGRTPLRLPGFGRAIRMGSTVTLNGIFTQLLMRADLVVMTYLASFQSVGIYRAAVTLGMVPLLLQPLFQYPLMQVAAGHLNADRRDEVRQLHRSLTCTIVLLVVPMVIGGWYYAAPLLEVVFGEEYVGGEWSLRWLLVAALFSVLIAPIGAIAHMDGRTAQMARASATGAGLMVILAIVLVPRYGGTGAALSACIAQGVWAILFMVMHHRGIGILLPSAGVGGLGAAVVGTVWVCFAMGQDVGSLTGMLWRLGAVVAVYALVLWVFGVLSPRRVWSLLMRGDPDEGS